MNTAPLSASPIPTAPPSMLALVEPKPATARRVSLAVTIDDDEPFADTADSFCDANPDLADEVRAMRPGDVATFGGGAQPVVVVEATDGHPECHECGAELGEERHAYTCSRCPDETRADRAFDRCKGRDS